MHLFRLLFFPALAYQCLAAAALLLFRFRKREFPPYEPAVSILKPIRGLDPNTYEAFASQAAQNYPEFEILFGVRDDTDPALPAIRSLQQQFPCVRLIWCTTTAANGKVGSLIDLAREARYPVWIVSDSDIKVTPDYIRSVVAPLQDPAVGLVTCPYRAYAHSAATGWEALGIAADFIPSTIVAQMLGVRDFGLGSTLAFRAEDLKRAGGFEALAPYLADDYQLARRIASLGKRALLSRYVVETSLGEGTWSGAWNHQLRWARTIRASKGPGYAGLPITQAGLWAAIAFASGAWPIGIALLAIRIGNALLSPARTNLWWLAPVWDVYAFFIWLTCWTGNTVRWRDRTLRIDGQGRIINLDRPI